MNTLLKLSLASALAFGSLHSAMAATAVSNLHDWSGHWVAAVDVMKKPDVDKALAQTYATLGKQEGISAEAWKSKKLATWDAGNVKSVEVTDDAIEFTLQDGTKITNHYTYKGEMETPYADGEMLNWYQFEGDQNNAYKYMIFRPSGKTETLSHFHFRNDANSFDAMKDEKVFKTVVAPDTTAEQLSQDFME